jgi:hypothetical protein
MSMLPYHLQHTLLPEGYVAGPNDVIVGRGRRCTLNRGNQRFNAIIQSTLEAYFNAESKAKKSEIIGDVLALVRADNGAGFIKQHCGSGRFLQVEEAASRIAIAQAFRDALSETYKSSKKNKKTRRLQLKGVSETEQSLVSASAQLQGFVNEESTQEPVARSIFEELPTLAFFSLPRTQAETADVMAGSWLRSILQEASPSVSAATNMQYQPFKQAHPLAMNLSPLNIAYGESLTPPLSDEPATKYPTLNRTSGDLLDSLCAIFGAIPTNSDPFEPTPLPTSTAPEFYSYFAPRAA